MAFVMEAACCCHMGKIRKNNEDNFCFDGKYLEVENNGLENPAYFVAPVEKDLCYAVFDGMGGENFGEVASYAAAREMQQRKKKPGDFFFFPKRYLNQLAMGLNEAVLQAKREQCTDRMGTTMVALYFTRRNVYMCNVGDSRAYRLRQEEFLQISEDHTEHYPGWGYRKAPLTQHLGIDPEDMLIEPYIARGDIRNGDMYLLCSDGLTDMLTDPEISCLMRETANIEECAGRLVEAALEKGGRDNITVIVCKIKDGTEVIG